jgi:PAS domain S-box-containing protein
MKLSTSMEELTTGGQSSHPRPDRDALALFFERTKDPAVVTGPDHRIEAVNRSAAALFGYTSNELVGRSLQDLVPTIRPAPTGQPPIISSATVLARHRDGTALRLRVSFRPVPIDEHLFTATCFHPQDGAGKPVGETALDRLPLPVMRFDATGRVLYANHRSSALSGRARGEAIGRRLSDFPLSSPMARTLAAVIDETIRTGEEGALEIAVGTGPTWFEALVVAEGLPGAPGTTALLTALDITTHHQAAAQLEMSEQRFRRLAEGSQDLISQHSRTGQFVYASPAATLVLGQDADSLIGRSIDDIVCPKDRPAVRNAMRAAQSSRLKRCCAGISGWWPRNSMAVNSASDHRAGRRLPLKSMNWSCVALGSNRALAMFASKAHWRIWDITLMPVQCATFLSVTTLSRRPNAIPG